MAGRPNVLYGALLLIIASASWGAMFPVAGEIFKVVNPYYFTLLRYVPVAIILAIILYFKEGPRAFRSEGHLLMIWFFGTMGFTVYNLLMFIGQEQLGDPGVLIASIMEASVPILSAIVMWAYYRVHPGKFTLGTILIAFVGVSLVVTNGDFSTIFSGGRLIPFLFLLIAALGWALYTIGGSRLPQWSVLRYSTLSLIYGMLTTLVVVGIGTAMGKITVPTLPEIFSVKYHFLFMILFPGLFALLGWNKGVQSLGPLNAVLFINIAPITTVVIRLVQGHGVEPLELLGVIIVCSMIVANNIYSRYQYRRQLRESIHQSMPDYKDESEGSEKPIETVAEITPIDRV